LELWRRKTIWVPTALGGLTIAAAGAFVVFMILRGAYPFLAVSRPIGRGTLVVEGWMNRSALISAVAQYHQGEYDAVVTTGGSVHRLVGSGEAATYAERSAEFLKLQGIQAERVVVLRTESPYQDRTYQSALAVRGWLLRTGRRTTSVDVISYGPHARRSWYLYRLALEGIAEVGVVASKPSFDSRKWWRNSGAAKEVLIEAAGWAWARCCFRRKPDPRNGGIGITIYSHYPSSDRYYRLRRFGTKAFHIAAHPDDSPAVEPACMGASETDVFPDSDRCYRFRFQAFAIETGTRLRAKVWPLDETEPGKWQIDCTDEAESSAAGPPGLWSMGPGVKLWDDIRIQKRDSDETLYFEDFENYGAGEDPLGWLDTGPANALQEDADLFKTVMLENGGLVFGTASAATNIHSHLRTPESRNWTSYEMSGRMAITSPGGGLVRSNAN
jgi:hypothetical protein